MAFWWIQLLMGLATVSGFLWMTGTLFGFTHQQGAPMPDRFAFLAGIYQLPFWQWLLIFSFAGLVSAYAFYWSFQSGVDSALRYQKKLVAGVLKTASTQWQAGQRSTAASTDEWNSTILPGQARGYLLRLIKTNTHLAGQVNRMLTRSIIPLLTSLAGAVALLYLDPVLTLILVPVLAAYVIGLYHINKHAANVSDELMRTSTAVNPGIVALIQPAFEPSDFHYRLENSGYEDLSRLKYQRRLVNIHVTWLKTVLLVFAILLLSGWFMLNHNPEHGFDWTHLILYLIIVRFTANALATVGMTTVVFSRFYPEIKALKEYLDNPKQALANATRLCSEELSELDDDY
jgi:ABC-type multidrug transport system fused ATPase/permease subunit